MKRGSNKKTERGNLVKNLKILIVCLVVVYSVAFLGSLFTTSKINSEGYNSVKPSITPPNYVFPVVWNILVFLIALSLYFVWIKSDKKSKRKIVLVFGLNLFLIFYGAFFILECKALLWHFMS